MVSLLQLCLHDHDNLPPVGNLVNKAHYSTNTESLNTKLLAVIIQNMFEYSLNS